MAKQDAPFNEQQDRSDSTEAAPQQAPRQDARPGAESTQVKNAHAAGDGAMGRNDEEQLGSLEPQSEPLK